MCAATPQIITMEALSKITRTAIESLKRATSDVYDETNVEDIRATGKDYEFREIDRRALQDIHALRQVAEVMAAMETLRRAANLSGMRVVQKGGIVKWDASDTISWVNTLAHEVMWYRFEYKMIPIRHNYTGGDGKTPKQFVSLTVPDMTTGTFICKIDEATKVPVVKWHTYSDIDEAGSEPAPDPNVEVYVWPGGLPQNMLAGGLTSPAITLLASFDHVKEVRTNYRAAIYQRSLPAAIATYQNRLGGGSSGTSTSHARADAQQSMQSAYHAHQSNISVREQSMREEERGALASAKRQFDAMGREERQAQAMSSVREIYTVGGRRQLAERTLPWHARRVAVPPGWNMTSAYQPTAPDDMLDQDLAWLIRVYEAIGIPLPDFSARGRTARRGIAALASGGSSSGGGRSVASGATGSSNPEQLEAAAEELRADIEEILNFGHHHFIEAYDAMKVVMKAEKTQARMTDIFDSAVEYFKYLAETEKLDHDRDLVNKLAAQKKGLIDKLRGFSIELANKIAAEGYTTGKSMDIEQIRHDIESTDAYREELRKINEAYERIQPATIRKLLTQPNIPDTERQFYEQILGEMDEPKTKKARVESKTHALAVGWRPLPFVDVDELIGMAQVGLVKPDVAAVAKLVKMGYSKADAKSMVPAEPLVLPTDKQREASGGGASNTNKPKESKPKPKDSKDKTTDKPNKDKASSSSKK